MKVRDILTQKGNTVHSVRSDVTVYDALKIMSEKNIGAVLVVDNGNISGIFTERDYARKLVLRGKVSKETSVSDVMVPSPLVTVTEEEDIPNCMNLMTNRFIRHLPVMRDKELVGVISIGDVVKNIINEQQFIIDNLGNYIAGVKS